MNISATVSDPVEQHYNFSTQYIALIRIQDTGTCLSCQ